MLKDGHNLHDLLSRRQNAQTKIDLDDLLGTPKRDLPTSPKVHGYGFVLTPSPVPGKDASPFVTWGTLDQTPLRLDPTDTPIDTYSAEGPQFKIPETPLREKVGIKLAEKTQYKLKQSKQNAKRYASPYTKKPLSQKGHKFVERLAKKRNSKEDFQLRASYGTPTRSAGRTSVVRSTTSKNLPLASPTIVITPKANQKRKADDITTDIGVGSAEKKQKTSSLTDNLLDINVLP